MTYYEHHLRFSTIIDERISILFNLLFSKQSSASEWKSLSCVRLFGTPWTIKFVEFSRPEYWSE